MKRTFKCVVERRDEYEIEFDDEIIDGEFIKHYQEYFGNAETLEHHAENISQFRARFGERFIEGYGRPLVNGKKPIFAEDSELQEGINIKVIDEDDDWYVDVEEI